MPRPCWSHRQRSEESLMQHKAGRVTKCPAIYAEMNMMNLFHEGERKMQALAGETEEADLNAPMIAPHILKGAIPFLASQPFAVLGLEHDGEIWATYLIGQSGFISVPDQFRLVFDL